MVVLDITHQIGWCS